MLFILKEPVVVLMVAPAHVSRWAPDDARGLGQGEKGGPALGAEARARLSTDSRMDGWTRWVGWIGWMHRQSVFV